MWARWQDGCSRLWTFLEISAIQLPSTSYCFSWKFYSSSIRPAEQNMGDFTLLSAVWLVLISATDKGRLLCCCRETHPTIQSFFLLAPAEQTQVLLISWMIAAVSLVFQLATPVTLHWSRNLPLAQPHEIQPSLKLLITPVLLLPVCVPNVCGENTFRASQGFFPDHSEHLICLFKSQPSAATCETSGTD